MNKLMSISALFSLGAFLMMPVVAGAAGATNETRETRISNENTATVRNTTISVANTGFNYADGSYGGDAGNGGDVEGGDDEVEGVGTGDGGNGGVAGDGGAVQTGDAITETVVLNRVNTNRTVVSDGEDNDNVEYNALTVRNRNGADLGNTDASITNTGAGYASGSYAGEGGDGGEVEGEDDEVENIGTGNGGDGNDSGLGGTVVTGNSRTSTATINVVNRNITRVLR